MDIGFLSHLSGDEALRKATDANIEFLSHLSGDEEERAVDCDVECVSKSPER